MIRTPRLILRDFRSSDLVAYSGLRAHPDFQRFYPAHDTSAEMSAELLGEFLNWAAENPRSRYQLAVEEPRIIVGLRLSPEADKSVTLVYDGDVMSSTLRAVSFLSLLGLLSACDGNPVGEDASNVSGRWIYRASELTGTEVTCSTSDVVLTLVRAPGSIRVDARFQGSAFAFSMECQGGDRSATLLFTGGTSVVNGEIEGGVVAFDFEAPDFIHTGTVVDGAMSGTVATRLDLSQSPLSEVGIVNLIGEWEAVRD